MTQKVAVTNFSEELAWDEKLATHPERYADVDLVVPGTDRHRTSYSAVDLLATDFPEPRWAVRRLLPEGLTFCAGAPKLGKSWLALNIAVAVSSGGRALGKIPVEQGDVLYLALEDSPRRLKSRLSLILKGDAPPAGLHFETIWTPLRDGGIADLDGWLTRVPSCRLIIIDVFARVRTAAGDKADRYMADYRAAEPLQALAHKHSVAIVAIHHTRKAGADDFLETISGTHGLAGAADTIAVLSRSRSEADAELHLTGRDIEEQKLALSFTPEVGTWTLKGDAEEWSLSPTRRAILDLLKTAATGQTPKEIHEATGIGYENVKQTVTRMASAGQIKAENGTYKALSTPVTPVTHVTELAIDGGDSSD